VAAQLMDAFCLFCVEEDIRVGKGFITITLHEIAIAQMTVFIGGDEITIRVTGPFTFATRFATDIALSVYVGDVSSGRKMDSIRIVHVGRGSDERKHRFIRVLRSGRKMDSIRIVHVGKGSDERKGRVLRSGRKMDSIRIVHVGRGSDERKHKFRALRSGKSGRIGNKRGSHL
jgi:hypothetical protein